MNENNDTIIKYNFFKEDLRDLRLYISYLEWKKDLSNLNEQIISEQDEQLYNYEIMTSNLKKEIELRDKVSNIYKEDYLEAIEQVEKYKKKSKK